MSEVPETTIVDVDGGRLVDRLRTEAEGTVFSVVEYDADAYNPLYVADAARTFYDDDQHMRAHFDRIHSYVHLDFVEMDLFTDELFTVAEDVEYIVTAMDFLQLVRVYVDGTGVFFSVEPDEPVVPLVQVVRELLATRS